MKAQSIALMMIFSSAMSMTGFLAQADVPKAKSEPLASVLKSSFRERDADQMNYKENGVTRPDEQARREMKEIRVEIGDELAGPGQLVKTTREL